MKLCIISPGKNHSVLVKDFIQEFEMRLSATYDIEWVFPEAGTKKEEAKKILQTVKSDDYVILLDERGKQIKTEGLAEILEIEKNNGTKRMCFIIGGAFGVDEEVASRANRTISLSLLVFPHMLVRAILIEQLYRAHTILSGGKYHHE